MARKPRILLIDDSEETVDGLEAYLNSRFEVVTARDGLEALREFDHQGFDLIITDLIMAVVNGFSLISFLRQKSPHTPIIAMTGWSRPNGLPAVTEADVLLMKPFELEELDQSLDKLIV